jgi:hypothetical protein
LGCPAKIIKSEGEREANLREQTIHAGIRKLQTYAFLHIHLTFPKLEKEKNNAFRYKCTLSSCDWEITEGCPLGSARVRPDWNPRPIDLQDVALSYLGSVCERN